MAIKLVDTLNPMGDFPVAKAKDIGFEDGETLQEKMNNGTLFPIGGVIPFAGQNTPEGYLMCHGQEVSRTEYSSLFDIIGTTYGEGDGSTTFNLPDLRDKFAQGASETNALATVKEAGLPNITGMFYHNTVEGASYEGAFSYLSGTHQSAETGSTKNSGTINFNASRSSSIYGKSSTVQPPAVCMNYIIRAL